jgi:hypothetical protein
MIEIIGFIVGITFLFTLFLVYEKFWGVKNRTNSYLNKFYIKGEK